MSQLKCLLNLLMRQLVQCFEHKLYLHTYTYVEGKNVQLNIYVQ